MEKTFDIFGTQWKVIYCDKIEVDNEDTFKFGLSDSINNVISIATKNLKGEDLPQREVQLTLLHEIVHAICDSGQYSEYSRDDAFVEWMARCILSLNEQHFEF